MPVEDDEGSEDDEERELEGEDEEGEEGMEHALTHTHPSQLIPPHLREISSLASWTVSSSKPGCSIPQLRSPNTSLFWQSDGPQPHYLNIHFFKLVRIVGLRLYLDFEADESYTPTRIVFLAGSGGNDLQEWGEMRLEQPRGWVWVGFEGVDDVEDDDENDDEEESESPNETKHKKLPVLRAHLVQIKILENHQNGKDTHLRGLQIFARDNDRETSTRPGDVGGSQRKKSYVASAGVAETTIRRGREDGGMGVGIGRSMMETEICIR
jgi:anaphase-promoting complex subunit 10